MRKTTAIPPALALGVAAAMSVAIPAFAVPITYTEQATGSGCLGATSTGSCPAGNAFTNAALTLTMTNDTGNVTGSGPIFDNVGTLTLSITGFPTATFTDAGIEAAVNQTVRIAGFSDPAALGGTGSAILATQNTTFSTYNLKTSIGPVSGSAIFNSAMPAFPTTDGLFILTGVSPANSTFTATTSSAVPEPASLILLAVGFAGFSLVRRRLKR